MKIIYYIRLLFLILFYSSITSLLFSQEKRLEFNIGFAPPLDAIHVGGNFKITRELDFGLSIGTIPEKLDFNNHVNIGIETKYKFGESRTVKERIEMGGRMRSVRAKTWYGGARMHLVTDTRTADTEKKYLYITPAIGRHFNFNKSMGLTMDFGLALTANQVTTYAGNSICRTCILEEHPQYPLLPSFRMQFFIKI